MGGETWACRLQLVVAMLVFLNGVVTYYSPFKVATTLKMETIKQLHKYTPLQKELTHIMSLPYSGPETGESIEQFLKKYKNS